jgi:hypothetical protein
MVEKQLAYDSYGIDESGKWANVFKDAGLRFLPDGKPLGRQQKLGRTFALSVHSYNKRKGAQATPDESRKWLINRRNSHPFWLELKMSQTLSLYQSDRLGIGLRKTKSHLTS